MRCIFCDFVAGRIKKSAEGYPYIPIFETRNSVSFLSLDFIATEEGHTLVIPEKHFENLEGGSLQYSK